jgi:hypothetical protein
MIGRFRNDRTEHPAVAPTSIACSVLQAGTIDLGGAIRLIGRHPYNPICCFDFPPRIGNSERRELIRSKAVPQGGQELANCKFSYVVS